MASGAGSWGVEGLWFLEETSLSTDDSVSPAPKEFKEEGPYWQLQDFAETATSSQLVLRQNLSPRSLLEPESRCQCGPGDTAVTWNGVDGGS